jgi:hypothetical protein
MGVSVNATRPVHLSLEKRPHTHCTGAGWAPRLVCTRAENLAFTEIRPTDCPARSESLYRLRYPGPR